MNLDIVQKALPYLAQGMSRREIAKAISVPKSTLQDALKAYYKALADGELQPLLAEGEDGYTGITGPRILLLDIETAPCKAYYWRRWKENIGQDQVLSESFVLTISAKWLGSDEVHAMALTPVQIFQEDDREVILGIWALLDAADIVIAQNGKRFDIPRLNSRFVFHDLMPPTPYKLVDTLEIAKKNFGFPSNSLNSLGLYLGVGEKTKHEGFVLWRRVMEGEEDAIQEMLDYNVNDVLLMEDVYLKLRAWDVKAPNLANYFNDAKRRCVCCGSENVKPTGDFAYTQLSKFEILRCEDCGKPMRARMNLHTKQKMQTQLQNVL